jgi:predicted nucleotidyltransferase component of viral defense system
MLFFSTISPEALELLKDIQNNPGLNDFYLVGGTALALQYGHRISVDLDFFTDKEFDTNSVIGSLNINTSVRILSQAKNSLTLDIGSVKTDFIRHNYPLLNPVACTNKIRMASVEDIAAMKLNSTMNRGSKHDYYAIFELLNHFTLQKLISFYTSNYDFSSQLIARISLVYFEDADRDPDPVSIKETSWNSVKKKISEEVGCLA